MLLRFDPFRELDRLNDQAWGRGIPSLPMEAVRRGDDVVVTFDLPGVDPGSIDLTVERDVLTVRAERPPRRQDGDEVLVAERRYGTLTRQLMLGDALDTERLEAAYDRGVLSVTIPASAAAKPRKVEVTVGGDHAEAISASATESGPTAAA